MPNEVIMTIYILVHLWVYSQHIMPSLAFTPEPLPTPKALYMDMFFTTNIGSHRQDLHIDMELFLLKYTQNIVPSKTNYDPQT